MNSNSRSEKRGDFKNVLFDRVVNSTFGLDEIDLDMDDMEDIDSCDEDMSPDKAKDNMDLHLGIQQEYN